MDIRNVTSVGHFELDQGIGNFAGRKAGQERCAGHMA